MVVAAYGFGNDICTHLAMAEASYEGVTRPEAEPREAPNPAADLALRKFGLSWCSSNWGHAKLVLLPLPPKYVLPT